MKVKIEIEMPDYCFEELKKHIMVHELVNLGTILSNYDAICTRVFKNRKPIWGQGKDPLGYKQGSPEIDFMVFATDPKKAKE